jgi:hypothetical protein
VYFTDGAGNALAEGAQYTFVGGTAPGVQVAAPASGTLALDGEGKATIALKHGQSVRIIGIAADAKIRIVETRESSFTPSFTDSAGEPSGPDTNDTGFRVVWESGPRGRTIAFANRQNMDPVPTSMTADARGLAIRLLIVISFALCVWAAFRLVERKLRTR